LTPGIDVESRRLARIVNACDLRLRRVWEVLRSESKAWQRQGEALVNVHSMIAGDHVGIIDAQQLSEGVPGEGNILEGIFLGASHARDEQQTCRQGKPDYVERHNPKAIGPTAMLHASRRLSGEKSRI